MEHRLTLVDLRLDPKLNAEYFLIHSVCTSFTHDALLAGLHPKLAYTPYVSQWREKREVDPRTFRRQGLPLGRLDNSLDALITTEAGGQRLATFGEFEERLRQVSDDDVSSGLGAARDLLSDFRPSRRPVLARILVVQLLLYAALRRGLYEEKADYLSLVTNALESVSHVADLFALHEPALPPMVRNGTGSMSPTTRRGIRCVRHWSQRCSTSAIAYCPRCTASRRREVLELERCATRMSRATQPGEERHGEGAHRPAVWGTSLRDSTATRREDA
jgi:hypothetical protein